LYTLIFTFLERRQKDKRLNTVAASIPRNWSALNFFSYCRSETYEHRHFQTICYLSLNCDL